ncbi:transposase, partial [Bradyrhizobium sp. 197]|uniref:transposase n=1 Tax=Bradyrhizobium sp. 197 TaxID=2782663 RepID=UPI001FF7551C
QKHSLIDAPRQSERTKLLRATIIAAIITSPRHPLAILIVARFPSRLSRYSKKAPIELEPWLERARASLVMSFANGVIKDKAAVSAAITTSWSNGQTEGQITKLKLVKRQMYGRAKLDLLQARLIGAT